MTVPVCSLQSLDSKCSILPCPTSSTQLQYSMYYSSTPRTPCSICSPKGGTPRTGENGEYSVVHGVRGVQE